MPLDAINVSTIINASKTSRTTFYRYFKDKQDVVLWIYITEADRIAQESTSFSELALNVYKRFYENRFFIRSALSYEQQNSLVDYINQRSLRDCFDTTKKALGVSKLPREIEASVEFFCAGCLKTWHNWVFSEMGDTPEVILEIIMRNMPEPIRPFFA